MGIISFATSKVPECHTSSCCIFITGSFANSTTGTSVTNAGHRPYTNFGGHGDHINTACAIANSFTGSHGNTCGTLGNSSDCEDSGLAVHGPCNLGCVPNPGAHSPGTAMGLAALYSKLPEWGREV